VRHAEPHHLALGLDLERAARVAVGLELGPELVSPSQYQGSRRIDLQNLARVGQSPVRKLEPPRRPLAPVALQTRPEPILLRELRVGERLPELFGVVRMYVT